MAVLFIGGVFCEINETEIMENSKKYAEFSANIFQKKLIKGFKDNKIDIDVISAPLIGAYPLRYKKMFFNGFKEEQKEYTYVNFNNLWGYRNFSRAKSLKSTIKKLILKDNKRYDLILAYSAHQPFLEAAVYAKKLLPKSKICFVVPDLPQYMNLDANRSKLYDILKRVDIKRMNRLMKDVDSFVILTEQMKEMLCIGNRPYMVTEGIIEEVPSPILESNQMSSDTKTVVYTGKINLAFGIKELVDSFMALQDDNYRLVLCGDGDAKSYVLEKSKQDNRIDYRGQVSPDEAKKIVESASVLVNPRPNNSEYTKYSFPSKNIEYLISGKPVVTYMLDGMPKEYTEFIHIANANTSLKEAIENALNSENKKRYTAFCNYAGENLYAKNVIKKLMKL